MKSVCYSVRKIRREVEIMRKSESKRSLTITRQDLVNEVIRDFNGRYSYRDVEDILNSFWDCITDHLASSTKNLPVIVKPFVGLQFSSKIVDEEKNALGTTFAVSSRRRVRVKLTQYFTRKKMNGLKA